MILQNIRQTSIGERHKGIITAEKMKAGCVTVLEIVLVGQCEVFVCLDFVLFFLLGREAHRSANGVSIL